MPSKVVKPISANVNYRGVMPSPVFAIRHSHFCHMFSPDRIANIIYQTSRLLNKHFWVINICRLQSDCVHKFWKAWQR